MRTMIDLSHWQDNKTGDPPNLQLAVDNAVDAFLFRCGRGTGATTARDLDPSYAGYVAQAVDLGVPWGAYWWPEPNESDPAEQAELFVSRAHSAGLPSFLDVDIETYRGNPLPPLQLAQWYRTFIDELRHLTNLPIVIYAADWVWNSKVFPSEIDFDDCDLRVAHYYPGQPPARATGWTAWIANREPDPVAGWETWSAWQFSATGNGLGPALGLESNDVDLNVIREDAWQRWTAHRLDDAISEQLGRIAARIDTIGEAVVVAHADTDGRLDHLDARLVGIEGAVAGPWQATITRATP